MFKDKIIELDKKSNIFLFLENIQDEVHRFAISYHRDVHSKNMFISKLDSIKGIGKVKKQKILSIIGEEDFDKKIFEIGLNDLQIKEVLDIYKLRN